MNHTYQPTYRIPRGHTAAVNPRLEIVSALVQVAIAVFEAGGQMWYIVRDSDLEQIDRLPLVHGQLDCDPAEFEE